tara:strand:+ start:33389 stop:34222 length:834 start_codon:yes stop_codon:yes gene_type:complete
MIIRTMTIVLLIAVAATGAAEPVSEHRAWTETYAVGGAAPLLYVNNVWGSVQVRPGPGGEIRVSIDEFRSAATPELFARSRTVLPLLIDADAAGVSIEVGNRKNGWNFHNKCIKCRVDYQFVIEVPPGSIVDVSTVMDGKVDVSGVSGPVSASNVNGPVSVSDIAGCEKVHSVNGPIRLGFKSAPVASCDIETINGNITMAIPDNSSVDLLLDLFNGKVDSEFGLESFMPPATVEQVTDEGRTLYRVQQQAGLRIGAGGPVFSISSMNGDVRVKRVN